MKSLEMDIFEETIFGTNTKMGISEDMIFEARLSRNESSKIFGWGGILVFVWSERILFEGEDGSDMGGRSLPGTAFQTHCLTARHSITRRVRLL